VTKGSQNFPKISCEWDLRFDSQAKKLAICIGRWDSLTEPHERYAVAQALPGNPRDVVAGRLARACPTASLPPARLRPDNEPRAGARHTCDVRTVLTVSSVVLSLNTSVRPKSVPSHSRISPQQLETTINVHHILESPPSNSKPA
jgi:hypothetical protein